MTRFPLRAYQCSAGAGIAGRLVPLVYTLPKNVSPMRTCGVRWYLHEVGKRVAREKKQDGGQY